jgi:hypothetical protein
MHINLPTGLELTVLTDIQLPQMGIKVFIHNLSQRIDNPRVRGSPLACPILQEPSNGSRKTFELIRLQRRQTDGVAAFLAGSARAMGTVPEPIILEGRHVHAPRREARIELNVSML